jgi:hypothetical protein
MIRDGERAMTMATDTTGTGRRTESAEGGGVSDEEDEILWRDRIRI